MTTQTTDLAAECHRLHAEYVAATAESRRLEDALRATLNAEQNRLLNLASDADVAVRTLRADWIVA